MDKLSKKEKAEKAKLKREEDLTKHAVIIDTTDEQGKPYRQFQCKKCLTYLASSNLLKRHIDDTHDGM